MGNRRILAPALALSLLLHVGLIVLGPALQGPSPGPEPTVALSFRASESPAGVFTEPPESARVPERPLDAIHPAELDARAQNPEPAPEVDGRPRSVGDLEIFDFKPTDLLNQNARQRALAEAERRRREQPDPDSQQEREGGTDGRGAGDVALHQPEDGPEGEERQQPESTQSGARSGEGGRPRLRHSSPRSRVATEGELSLSTYAWAWAPYLKYLKERISEHWQPPLAFYMGLIEGEGVIRFRVHPDGSITHLNIVTEEGHASLARAARNAVEYALPLKALPPDFPEDHLDIQWHYRYILY
jgi:outer membrane biosynthesis protein TonB